MLATLRDPWLSLVEVGVAIWLCIAVIEALVETKESEARSCVMFWVLALALLVADLQQLWWHHWVWGVFLTGSVLMLGGSMSLFMLGFKARWQTSFWNGLKLSFGIKPRSKMSSRGGH